MSKSGVSTKQRQQFISKFVIIAILIIFQTLLFFSMVFYMGQARLWLQTALKAISIFVVLVIVNKQDNPSYKLAWCIPILLFPVIGGLLYVILAGNRTRRKFIKSINQSNISSYTFMPQDEGVMEEVRQLSKSAYVQSSYISRTAHYPIYKNTSVKYFSVGEDNFEELKKELENAKHFIFMEYFIIKNGILWETILEILTRKAKQGVDVRIIYDDMGCAIWLPSKFPARMNQLGIKCVPFNPFKPVICLRQNNRDHRKITVIDGQTGFTGGINLADEYINETNPFGHWKDTGIMLKGDAVWNLTMMFLQNWHHLTNEEEDYSIYKPNVHKSTPIYSDGYIQPYGDTPVDNEIVGENIYLNMINKAKRYIYLTTPYLIIDNEMFTALTLAAKSGIDVRIITPGIPDKKTVYTVTQSYYYHLIQAGVRIYQYTPGFIHAKTFVSDDVVATVGTVNLDFRSLYLHFECGVWMFNSGAIYEIKEDFVNTLDKCDEIKMEEIKNQNIFKSFWQSILRLVAPLL